MPKKSSLAFKILSNRAHSGRLEEYTQFLPERERTLLNEIPVESIETAPLVKQAGKALLEIHYSWIAPHIKNLAPEMIPIAINALDPSQRKGLFELLQVKPPAKKPTAVAQDYILKLLKEKVIDPSIMPKEYLPESSLNSLLELNKAFLVEVIDLFGIHDLSEKIRSIVDKTKLRAIYKCLSPVKLKFLEFILRQTEKMPLSELDLIQWDGNCEKFLKTLHKRGLVRFSKAISKETPDFIWHIMHKLDTGRAEFIEKEMQLPVTKDVAQLLKNQLITIVNLINHKRVL